MSSGGRPPTSTGRTHSGWPDRRLRAPSSPAAPSSSGHTERSNRVGWAGRPWYEAWTTGPWPPRHASATAAMASGRTPGWSPRRTTTAPDAELVARSPARSEVDWPLAWSGLCTSRACGGSFTASATCSDACPTTTAISSSPAIAAASRTCCSTGRPPRSRSCLARPSREEDPAARMIAVITVRARALGASVRPGRHGRLGRRGSIVDRTSAVPEEPAGPSCRQGEDLSDDGPPHFLGPVPSQVEAGGAMDDLEVRRVGFEPFPPEHCEHPVQPGRGPQHPDVRHLRSQKGAEVVLVAEEVVAHHHGVRPVVHARVPRGVDRFGSDEAGGPREPVRLEEPLPVIDDLDPPSEARGEPDERDGVVARPAHEQPKRRHQDLDERLSALTQRDQP